MKRLTTLIILLLPVLFATLACASDVAEYTRAIEQSPVDMKYKFYLLRGLAYRDNGNIDEAIRDFGTSIRLRPTYEGFLRRGEMYFEKGSYTIAEHDFSEAIAKNPTIDAYKMRGLTYLVLGNLEMAIADGTELIKLAPNTSESYNIRMEAYAQIGKVKLAREDARRALELDRRNQVASELLVNYPEKIELTGGLTRYRPKGDINKYRIWANSKGFAFTLKHGSQEAADFPEETKAE